MKALRPALILALSIAVLLPAEASSDSTPLWVRHVQNYPGGISGGVRARLVAEAAKAHTASAKRASISAVAINNVQATADTDPDLPQNETSVAFKPGNPLIAVAGANDYFGRGVWAGNTTDGGKHWTSQLLEPTSRSGGLCFGGDPSVAYSLRDSAFYFAQLCFFGDSPETEVQVFKSTDDGATWNAPERSSIVIHGTDPAFFYDKELLAIDNNATSPHYGRIYVTYIRFHMQANGRGDSCPVQVSYTDNIPTRNPRRARWTRVSVVPDDFGGNGKGPSANQWAMPVVDDTGALNIAYTLEDCSSGLDRGMFFTRSTDGGQHFSAPVQIDKPGQFVDNPSLQDRLRPKTAGIPFSPSLVFNPMTKTLAFAYQNNVNSSTSGADISLQRSTDRGATWSDAAFISITDTGAPAPKDQFFPWLAADDSGDLHAIWFDNRNDPGNRLIETFQALSTDDGLTWSNFNISDVPWDPNISFFDCGCFIGDYNGLAASDEVIYPVWTDGRNTPGPPDGTTDIFVNVEIAD